MFDFLKFRRALLLTILLLSEALFYFAYPKQEIVLLPKPLRELPTQLGSWSMVSESRIEPEVQDVLKADDTLNRIYSDAATGGNASLFIAFFKTQKTGVAPHSPKVRLPGSGWEPSRSEYVRLPGSGWEPSRSEYVRLQVPGRAVPVLVNHSVIAKGAEKSIVLYWYQTHNNVIADEYRAKVNTVLDSVRDHRSDTAIVRIVVPERPGRDAEAEARSMAQSSFEPIRAILPK